MEILIGVIITAVKLICEAFQEKEANRYADMVVRRYKEEWVLLEYVIRHCESGKYLSLVKLRNEAVWVDLDKAHRFSDRQKVDN